MARVPVNAPTSVRINNKNLRDFGMEMTSYPSELLLPPVRVVSSQVESRLGSTIISIIYDTWEFTLNMYIHADTHADVMDKLDEFRRWIEIYQYDDYLKFELAGHKYWYSDGTVSVTQGSPNITGTGTYWLSYAKPEVEFKVSGDTTLYYVKHVKSNTSIVLTENISRTTDSGLSHQLERRKYLQVKYGGSSALSEITTTHPHFADSVYNLNLNFKVDYPYWVGDEFRIEFSSVSAESFLKLRGIGKTFNNPIYHIEGTATNPEIVVGAHVFHARFIGNPKYRDIRNLTDKSPATYYII